MYVRTVKITTAFSKTSIGFRSGAVTGLYIYEIIGVAVTYITFPMGGNTDYVI